MVEEVGLAETMPPEAEVEELAEMRYLEAVEVEVEKGQARPLEVKVQTWKMLLEA